MLGRLSLLVGGVLLLATGCSSRERLNPFDPKNQATGGRPANFQALAGNRQIQLRWSSAQTSGSLVGYQLFRRGPSETEFHPITDVLPATVTSLRDGPLNNGDDYSYRLYFVFVSGPGSLPAEDIATPGTTVPWAIESPGFDLIRISADGRHITDRLGGFTGTVDVAAVAGGGNVWVADEGAARVVIYQPVNGVTVTIPGLGRPHALAVNPGDGTGWVCDASRDIVYHFDSNGTQIGGGIPFTGNPVDAAVDVNDGSVWVCELAANLVGHYRADGSTLWRQTLTGPSRVAVDSTTRDGWISSFNTGTVTRLSEIGGTVTVVGGFATPLGVAVDSRRGRIWVADPGARSVIALRLDNTVEFRVSDLGDAGDVSVDAATGDAWVVLRATGELARVSPPSAGGAIRKLGGFHNPFSVSVDPGR